MASIDERVVQMQFDNRQFENGIGTSLKSLENLRTSLGKDFTTALGGLSETVGTIGNRFSNMGIVAITALQNITNRAIDAGMALGRSFTVDPLISGFNEYEQKLNSVQTILSNTASKGTTITQVTDALNELNTYADKTIYNFGEMTRNIGTFTAAGVDLDMAVSAIQGIANLAAASGSNAHQASTAMYQLSQALSTGTVKLMDWNSVVNAGMGGELFQNALKDTARESGVAIDQIIESAGSFRNSLQEGWLSADILNTTLKKFTREGAAEYAKSMMDSGKYTKEQSDALMEQAAMMEDAATKVKTFTQLMDTLKEAAQSGWAQTWEMIIGDFEEAKVFFTELSDLFGGLIGDAAEARNQVVSKGLSSGWQEFLSKGIADEAGYIEHVKTIAKERGIAIDEMIEKEGSFEATLKDGWLTSDIMKEAVSKLTTEMYGLSESELEAAGYTEEHKKAISDLNLKMLANKDFVNEMSDSITRVSGRENLIEALRNSINGLLSVIEPVKEAFKDVFPPMTGEQLYSLTERIKEITEGFKLTEIQTNNLKATFHGLFSAVEFVGRIFGSIFTGLKDMISVFLPTTSGFLETTASIGKFLTVLNETTDVAGFFEERFVKVIDFLKEFKQTFLEALKGVFPENNPFEGSLDKIAASMAPLGGISGILGSVFEKIGTVLEKVWEFLKGIGKRISDLFGGVLNFNNLVQLMNIGVLINVVPSIKKFIDGITGVFGTLEKSNVFSSISGVLDGVTDALKGFQDNLKADTLKKIGTAIAILAGSLFVIAMIDSDKLQHSLETITVLFADLMGSMILFDKQVTGGVAGLGKASAGMIAMSLSVLILSAALSNISKLDPDRLVASIAVLTSMMAEMVGVAKLMATNTRGFTSAAIGLILFSVAIKLLVDPITKLGSLDTGVLIQGLSGLGAIILELAGVLAMSNFQQIGIRTGLGLIAFAAAISILSNAVSTLGLLSVDSLIKGLSGFAGILLGIAGFTQILGKTNLIGIGIGMIAVGAGLMVISNSIVTIGNLSIEQIVKGLVGVGGALLIIAGTTHLMPKNLIAVGAGLVLVSASLKIISSALTAMGGMSWEEIGKGMVALGGSLLILAGALHLMNGTLMGSAALLVAALALAALTPNLIILGSLSWEAIGKGLVALGGALAIIGLAGMALTPALPGLIGLGTAMALIGVGVAAFGVGLAGIGIGITTIIAAITSLGAITAAQASAITVSLAAIITTISALIPTVARDIGLGIVELAKAIGNGASAIAEAAYQVLEALVQTVVKAIPMIVEAAGKFILALLDTLVSYLPEIVKVGIELIVALINGIAESIPDIIDAGVNVIIAFLKGIADATVKLADEGAKVIISFVNGMADAIDKNVPELITAFQRLGKSILDALVKTITSLAKGPIDAIKGLFTGMVDTGAKTIETNSPSKVFMRIGQSIPQGLVVGIEKDGDDVIYSIKTLSGEIIKMGEKELGINSGESSIFEEFGGITVESFIKGLEAFKKPLQDSLKEVFKTDEDTFDNINNLVDNAFSTIEQRLGSYEEIAGDRFSKLNTESEISVREMIENLQFNQKAMKQWAEGISDLAERGLNEGLLEQLREAGPASAGEVKSLIAATDKELQQLNDTFEKAGSTALNTFASSIGSSAQLVVKEGQTIIEALATSLSSTTSLNDAMYLIATGSIQALGQGFSSNIDGIRAQTNQAINSGILEPITNSNEAIQTGGQINGEFYGLGFIQGEESTIPDLIKSVTGFGDTSTTTLSSVLEEQSPSKVTEEIGINFGLGFINGINSTLEDAKLAVVNFSNVAIDAMSAFNTPFIESQPLLYQNGMNFIQYIIDGMNYHVETFSILARKHVNDFLLTFEQARKRATDAGKNLGNATANGLRIVISLLRQIGHDAAKAFIDEILAILEEAYNAGRDLAKALLDGFKEGLDIDSPSKEMYYVGQMTDRGLINGIRSLSSSVEESGKELGRSALKGVSDTISAISNILSSDLNLSPTIRPVIDLSDVNSGMDNLNSMFGNTSINMSNSLLRARSATSSFINPITRDLAYQTDSQAIQFIQNNTLRKAPTRIELYRQTKNLLALQKEAVGVV